MLIKCITCNTEFEAKRKDTKYCKECKRKRRVLQAMLSKKKRIPTTEIGVGSGNSTKNKKGMNNHNTLTGIQIYRDLIKQELCAWCGATTNLCVHHIDHNRHNNNVDNLVCVCRKCHTNYHNKRDSKGRFRTNTEVS